MTDTKMHELQQVLDGGPLLGFQRDLMRFLSTEKRASWHPIIDCFEDDTQLILQAELPRAAADDVNVHVDGDELATEGQRHGLGATLEHGLLTVTIPKSKPTTAKGDNH